MAQAGTMAQCLLLAACALCLQACEPWNEPTQPYDPSNGLEVNGISPLPLPLKDGVIHPKVFEMLECWVSDVKYPVALEVNLDAVEANGNQFDYSQVVKQGEWIFFGLKPGGFLRYRVLKRDGRIYSVIYQSNGGGSLTLSYEIEFKIDVRPLSVDGAESEVKTLKVLSFKLPPAR